MTYRLRYRQRSGFLDDAAPGAFFGYPVLTAKGISESANISLGAVRAALDDLQELRMGCEITGKRKGRACACEPLLDIIFATGRDPQREGQR